MLSGIDFVQQSLGIHLFFLRIMKEHSFFLEVGFTPRDINFTRKANEFRIEYDKILREVISLSNGVVNQDVLQSGEILTAYTLNAELVSSYYTGIHITTELTEAEAGLAYGNFGIDPLLEQRVANINQRVIGLTTSLIRFKADILSNILSCRMFTGNYPLLIDHIMREAKLYLRMIQRLQSRMDVVLKKKLRSKKYSGAE